MKFQLTGDEICLQALQELNAIAIGQTPLPEQLTHARQNLNALMQSWLAMGVNVWTLVRSKMTLTVGQPNYQLGHNIRELRIDECRIQTSTGVNEIDYPLVEISRREYWILPQQQTQGRPVQIYQERNRVLAVEGEDTQGNVMAWLYPTPDMAYVLQFAAVRRYNDVNSPLDDMDFPASWTLALKYGLALHLVGRYAQSVTNTQRIQKLYDEQMKIARGDDHERGGFRVMPTYPRGGY